MDSQYNGFVDIIRKSLLFSIRNFTFSFFSVIIFSLSCLCFGQILRDTLIVLISEEYDIFSLVVHFVVLSVVISVSYSVYDVNKNNVFYGMKFYFLEKFFYSSLVSRSYNDYNSNIISNTLNVGSDSLCCLLSSHFFILLRNFILIIGAIINLYLMSPKIVLLVIISGFSLGLLSLSVSALYSKCIRLFNNNINVSFKMISNIVSRKNAINIYGLQNQEMSKYKAALKRARKSMFIMNFNHSIIALFTVALVLTVVSVAILSSINGLREGSFNFYDFIPFLFYTLVTIFAIVSTIRLMISCQHHIHNSSKLLGLLNDLPASENRKIRLKENYSVIVENLAVSTDVKFQSFIPVGLNFEIKKGHKIAIVGGKERERDLLFNLLMGFTEVYDGSIKIDNHPISMMNLTPFYRDSVIISKPLHYFDSSVINYLINVSRLSNKQIMAFFEDFKNNQKLDFRSLMDLSQRPKNYFELQVVNIILGLLKKDAKFLFCGNIFFNLTPLFRKQFFQVIAKSAKEGDKGFVFIDERLDDDMFKEFDEVINLDDHRTESGNV